MMRILTDPRLVVLMDSLKYLNLDLCSIPVYPFYFRLSRMLCCSLHPVGFKQGDNLAPIIFFFFIDAVGQPISPKWE